MPRPSLHRRTAPPGRTTCRSAGLLGLAVASALLFGSGCGFDPGAMGGRGGGEAGTGERERGPGAGVRGAGPGRRDQQLALTPEQELQLGRKAYREILNSPAEYGQVLPADGPECRRVRRVADKIVQAAGIDALQREINLRRGFRYEWEANVLNKDQVNAFCLPGGKIAVFTGLLKMVQDNDAQLATVVSHEIAHALAHHTSERMARKGVQHGGLADVLGTFRDKAHEREEETEADHIGLFLMTFANYDPDEAVHFWEKMQRLGAKRQHLPEILSDHPSDARRVQKMKEWVSKAKAAKAALEQGRIEPERRR